MWHEDEGRVGEHMTPSCFVIPVLVTGINTSTVPRLIP